MAARIRSLRNGLNPVDEASRDDLVIGDVMLVSSIDAATTYNWALMYAPEGSVATFSGSTSAVSPGTFTVDKEGPYLVRLIVDAGLPTESTQYVRLRALTVALGLHLVAAGERRDGTGIIPVDVDIVGWADEQNANLLALEAALMGVSVAPEVFVFRPGGVAGGNVYTDWATLYANLAAASGASRKVIVDGSLGAINIPAGVYDFSNTILEGAWDTNAFFISDPPIIGAPLVNFANGVDIRNPVGLVNVLLGLPAGISTPVSFSGGNRVLVRDCLFGNDPTANPVISVSGQVRFDFYRSEFNGAEIVAALDATGDLQLYMDDRSRVVADQVSGPGTAALHLSYTSDCLVNTTQSSFAGTITTERRSLASNVEFDPTNTTFVTATEVQTAIEELDNSGAPLRFVFQPGGTALGNVYTNFATLYAALSLTSGLRELVLDDTFTTPIVIPAGVYDFTGVKWSSGGIVSTRNVSGGNHYTLVNFTAATVITGLTEIEGLVLQNTLPATSPLQYNSGGTDALYVNRSFIFSTFGSAPLIQVSGGTTLVMWFFNRAQGGGTNQEWIELVGADGLELEMLAECQVKDDSILGGALSFVTGISFDSSSYFNPAQPNYLGAPFPAYSYTSQADRVEVDPAPMTIVTSNEVQGALEDLDAAIANARNQIFPTSDQSNDALSGTLGVGRFAFNPTDWPLATNFYFGATFSVTNALQTGTVLLYNVTDAEVVTGTTLTTSSLFPVKQQSAALTVGAAAGNLKNTEKIYEIRLSITGALPTDIINLGTAYMLMD